MATAKKLPSGQWRVLVYVGKKPDGKREYKSFTAATKKEAEHAATEYLIGKGEKPARGKMSLSEAAAQYIEARRNVLSPWTINGYVAMAKRDLGKLEHVSVEDIDDITMQRFINAYAASHIPKSVRNLYGFIHSVIKEQIPNRAYNVKLPSKTKPKYEIPEDEDIQCALAYTENEEMWFAIAFCAMLGMRRGEICALTWGDVKNGKVDINKAIAKTDENALVVKNPKTYAGYRVLDLPAPIQKKLEQIKPADAKDEDRILSMSVHAVTSRWEHVREEIGIKCRFYDLRHYNASAMLAMGIPDLYAMKRMGHSTTNMLKNVYQHVLDKKQQETNRLITEKMAKLGEGLTKENE